MLRRLRWILLGVLLGAISVVFAMWASGRPAQLAEPPPEAVRALLDDKLKFELVEIRRKIFLEKTLHQDELSELQEAWGHDRKEITRLLRVVTRLRGRTPERVEVPVEVLGPERVIDRPVEVPKGLSCRLTHTGGEVECEADMIEVTGEGFRARMRGRAVVDWELEAEHLDGAWTTQHQRVAVPWTVLEPLEFEYDPTPREPLRRGWWVGGVWSEDGWGPSAAVSLQGRKWGVMADVSWLALDSSTAALLDGDYFDVVRDDNAWIVGAKLGRRW